jgi:hypothetical protein
LRCSSPSPPFTSCNLFPLPLQAHEAPLLHNLPINSSSLSKPPQLKVKKAPPPTGNVPGLYDLSNAAEQESYDALHTFTVCVLLYVSLCPATQLTTRHDFDIHHYFHLPIDLLFKFPFPSFFTSCLLLRNPCSLNSSKNCSFCIPFRLFNIHPPSYMKYITSIFPFPFPSTIDLIYNPPATLP